MAEGVKWAKEGGGYNCNTIHQAFNSGTKGLICKSICLIM